MGVGAEGKGQTRETPPCITSEVVRYASAAHETVVLDAAESATASGLPDIGKRAGFARPGGIRPASSRWTSRETGESTEAAGMREA